MNDIANELESVIISELKRAWTRYVYSFRWDKSGIMAPNLIITEAKVGHVGQWDSATRQMSFSRDLVTKRPWNEVLECLKHEMAHQYVHEVLHIDNEAPHGPAFKSVCLANKIDPAPKGSLENNKVTTTNHIVEKIQHLLKLASNAGASEEEARTAAELAHNMMLKYNIEVQEKNEERGYTFRYLGQTTGRIQAYMNDLANLLSKYYFVEVIWISTYDPRSKKRGHELEISGTIDNVEVAEYVWEFVSRAALSAWKKLSSSQEYKNKMYSDLYSGGRSYGIPSTATGYSISARYNFLIGFIKGYRSQLQAAEVKEISQGLVLAQDPALEAFYRSRHPHIVNLGGSRGGHYNHAMRNDGFAKGSNLKVPPAAKASKQYTPLLGK